MGITSLPDEVVHSILQRVPCRDTDMVLRTILPLVCKKWREILYLQGSH